VRGEDGLSPQDQLVLAFVPVRRAGPAHAVALAAGLELTSTLAALGRLELTGLVERLGADWKKVPVPGR
jgi:DNA processing protein